MTLATAGLGATLDRPGARHAAVAGGAELDVVHVGEDGWRVSISGADAGNPFALLGFVTLVIGPVGPRYQLCVIGKPGEAPEFDTLDEAVDALRPRSDEVGAILAGIRP